MIEAWKPSKAQLEEAHDVTIPDVIAPGLAVLFCGINPGLYSGATGRHFARPGNRFWPALHRSGFTATQLSPFEGEKLLALGLGVTNVVARTTPGAADLSDDELRAGGKKLERKVRRYAPRFLALLGLGAYRVAFGVKDAGVGEQERTIGDTRVWVLPNPSGLNAHYQLPDLVREFKRLRVAAFDQKPRRG